jgi:hypothetical protein
MFCLDSSLQNHVLEIIEVTHVAFCSTACLNNAECQSYNFQETENVAKLCELSSSTENASIADFAPRPGYSYYDAEVTNIEHLFWRIAQLRHATRP